MNFSLWLITFALRIYIRLTCRLDAQGMDKIPAKGPLIIISNHTGQIEVPVFATLLQPRRITGWGKVEAFDNWFLRWVFAAWKIIPVRRGEADMTALKNALRSLEEGYIFGIAPEGTRNNLKRLKRTDFHIRVGEPFIVKVEGKVTAEMRQEIVDEMMYEIAKLMPEEYRGEYSDMSKATRKYLVAA
jgi:1-acyl-sn-glycerol-3-phosphate acyltransferase